MIFIEEMKYNNEKEELDYLINKREWLKQTKGEDLRPNKLARLNELLKKSVDALLRQHGEKDRS